MTRGQASGHGPSGHAARGGRIGLWVGGLASRQVASGFSLLEWGKKRMGQLGVVLALSWGAWVGAGESLQSEFEAANKLYEQGNFAEAAAAYQKLLQSGAAAPALYFNLGNAWFKAGQIGHAIAAYRQAEVLAPRDPDVRANLEFARNQVSPPTAPPGRVHRWLGTLRLNEWTLLATGALWAWCALLALRQLRPSWKAHLKWITWLAALAFVLLSVGLASAYKALWLTPTVVVVEREVTVRTGPFDESPRAFTAHDGAELLVLDQKGDWVQVSDGTRRIGWLKRTGGVLFGTAPSPRKVTS